MRMIISFRQHLRISFCDENCVLEVRARLTISRTEGIAVWIELDFPAAKIEHRFNSYDHARLESFSFPCFAVIRHIGIFVDIITDAVTGQLLYDATFACKTDSLYSGADITDSFASFGGFYASLESFFRVSSRCSSSGEILPTGTVMAASVMSPL